MVMERERARGTSFANGRLCQIPDGECDLEDLVFHFVQLISTVLLISDSSLFKFKRCWIFFTRANGALGFACRIYVNGLHFMNDHMQLIFCQLGMASNCQESVRFFCDHQIVSTAVFCWLQDWSLSENHQICHGQPSSQHHAMIIPEMFK